MSFGYDPEAPPGYQDADIELAEVLSASQTAEDDAAILAEGCDWCEKAAVGFISAYKFQVVYCGDHADAADRAYRERTV